MWSKILLFTEILVLVLIAVIIWCFDINVIQAMIVLVVITISILITGFIAIKNRCKSVKSKPGPNTDIEASCESMIPSNPNATDLNQRQQNTSLLSDDSTVLRQSYFSPQIVNAVIENEDKPRLSLIANSEVPPSYDDALHLPKIDLHNDTHNAPLD